MEGKGTDSKEKEPAIQFHFCKAQENTKSGASEGVAEDGDEGTSVGHLAFLRHAEKTGH